MKQAAVADADTVDVMDVSGNVEEAEDAAVAARALAAVTHALVTRHAGFDGATGQAVSLLSALAANRMESMGAALRAAQPCMPASSSGAGFCAAACTVLPACLARARLCSLGAVQSEIVKLPPKMSAAAALAERNKVGINMGPIPQIRLVFTCVCPVACPCNTPAYLHESATCAFTSLPWWTNTFCFAMSWDETSSCRPHGNLSALSEKSYGNFCALS